MRISKFEFRIIILITVDGFITYSIVDNSDVINGKRYLRENIFR